MLTSILISHLEPPEFKQMDFGVPSVVPKDGINTDYIVGCSDGNVLAIERKTPNDLLGSIKDGRLFSQCHAMRQISQFCYVVITGKLYWTHNNKVQVDHIKTEWNWDSLQGTLLTVQEMGVNIVYTDDFKDAVIRLSKRNREDLNIHPIRKSEPMSPDEAFLSSLPGIGAIRAKEILAYTRTAASALDLLTNVFEDVRRIKGIGRNQKIKIREVLGLGPNEYLTINLWENDNRSEVDGN